MAENECENVTMSKRLEDVELKMDLILNNVNLLVSKLDKKVCRIFVRVIFCYSLYRIGKKNFREHIFNDLNRK